MRNIIKKIKVLFFYMSLLLVVSSSINSAELKKPVTEIYRFEAGTHNVSRLVLEKPHALIEGAGMGVTILNISGGILAKAPEPIIRNLTIIGEGLGTGIHLTNTWSAKIENVEIENFRTGIKFELSEEGRNLAGGKTLNQWPSATTHANHWGSRISLSDVRNVEIMGPGDGIVFKNSLKHTTHKNYWQATDEKRNGEFMNATTIWGGHIGVQGVGVRIGDGVGSTKIFGTYIDVSPAGGIVMEYGARGLTLIGGALDLNSAARKVKASRVTVPRRAKNTIQLIGVTPSDFDVTYK